MESKLDDTLLALLKTVDEGDVAAESEVPVIITLAPGTEPSAIEGLSVSHIFEGISAVSGTLSTTQLRALSQSDAIVKIEHDGEVRALEPDSDIDSDD